MQPIVIMKKLTLAIALLLVITSCSKAEPGQTVTPSATAPAPTTVPTEASTTGPVLTPQPTIPPPEKPQIIFFIGDGLGAAHRLAGQFYANGERRQLAMDSLPVFGWLVTDSYGGELAESGSAGTAMATGSQTYRDVVSLDIQGNELKTILEYAQDLDMSVGLVTNKYITDATTAVFAAHNESRLNTLEIAPQFLEHRVDVLFGGGEDDFLPIDMAGCYPEMGNRLDGRNLIAEAEEIGYIVICDREGFDSLDPITDLPVLGLFGDENMERPYSPSLAEMTETAIEILSQDPDGFFLVVEGAMIDIYSHFNQTTEMMEEVAWFDEAVQVGIDHAGTEPDTLILVTADHETGGLVVELESGIHEDEEGPFYMPNAIEFYVTWLTGEHTPAKVPVTASGPGADRLRGVHENSAVFDLMLEYLGLEKAVE